MCTRSLVEVHVMSGLIHYNLIKGTEALLVPRPAGPFLDGVVASASLSRGAKKPEILQKRGYDAGSLCSLLNIVI